MTGMSALPEFLLTVLSDLVPGPNSVNPDNDYGTTRPYVTLTFAQSLDAKIAGNEGQQLILSGKESMIMTHWSVFSV